MKKLNEKKAYRGWGGVGRRFPPGCRGARLPRDQPALWAATRPSFSLRPPHPWWPSERAGERLAVGAACPSREQAEPLPRCRWSWDATTPVHSVRPHRTPAPPWLAPRWTYPAFQTCNRTRNSVSLFSEELLQHSQLLVYVREKLKCYNATYNGPPRHKSEKVACGGVEGMGVACRISLDRNM